MPSYKLIAEESHTNLRSKFGLRFFFRYHEENCFKIDAHVEYMRSNGITEMDLWLAERDINSPYFYCGHLNEVGLKIYGDCGKSCEWYQAKNKTSGACKNFGFTFEKTDKRFTLKLTDVVQQKEN